MGGERKNKMVNEKEGKQLRNVSLAQKIRIAKRRRRGNPTAAKDGAPLAQGNTSRLRGADLLVHCLADQDLTLAL